MTIFGQTKPHIRDEVLYFLHFLMIFGVVLANVLLSRFLRQQNIPFQINENPIGFWFAGYYSSAFLLILATSLVYYLNLISQSFIGVALILTGIYSNFVEKLIWGNVIDYLTIGNLHFNLADLQIVLGLIFLNYKIWTRNKPYVLGYGK